MKTPLQYAKDNLIIFVMNIINHKTIVKQENAHKPTQTMCLQKLALYRMKGDVCVYVCVHVWEE